MEASSESEQNSAMLLLFMGDQYDSTPRQAATLILLGQLMKEPVFTSLRTRQQLGYIVSAYNTSLGSGNRGEVGCIAIKVLSKTHAPPDVEASALEFLASFSNRFLTLKVEPGKEVTRPKGEEANEDSAPEGITAADFAKAKAALSSKLLQPPKNLANEVSQWWSEVQYGDERWGRYEDLAEALDDVTLQDVRSFFHHLVLDKTTRRHFAVHVHCRHHPILPLPEIDDDTSDGGNNIFNMQSRPLKFEDWADWKQKQSLFPA